MSAQESPRPAIEEYLVHVGARKFGKLSNADCFLAWLWREGFKVVPIEPGDDLFHQAGVRQ